MSATRTDSAGREGASHPILRRTPLHQEHVALGAVFTDFGGWEMPLRYGSIPDEHLMVRRAAGLFDLGHMGRLEYGGHDAARWVERLITNHYGAMRPGDARYTLFLNEEGTILDDAIVYRPGPAGGEHAGEESVFVVVNAANRARIVEWSEAHRGGLQARLRDRTGELGMVAIQGQESLPILASVLEAPAQAGLGAMKYYSIARGAFAGKAVLVARTGYTGEDGYEVYLDAAETPRLWRRLLESGGASVRPIGLGARDTLRLEAGMPLYGHEIDLSTDPFEAGLDFAVKLGKEGGFIGSEALAARRERVGRRLAGFRVGGRRVARQGMKIHLGEREVGEVTSGAPSPTLGVPIAMGYLRREAWTAEGDLTVDVRGNRERIERVELPFYSRTRKKKQN